MADATSALTKTREVKVHGAHTDGVVRVLEVTET